MALKRDADAIRRVLARRKRELTPVLGPRAWWMDFGFHFTDVRNAAGVLSAEGLLCRGDACDRGLMIVENADKTKIAKGAHLTDRYARLYFRPLTPTQYRNEGARPVGERPLNNAHCPVPVFFLFHLESLLVTRGVYFTRCAAHWDEAELLTSARELETMPWRDIYSSGGMGDRRWELTGARHAEILAQEALGLDNLERVVCRTGPERDTLLYLLADDVRKKWRAKVKLAGRGELFHGQWTYLERVTWVDGALVFTFSPHGATFQVSVRVTDLETGKVCMDKQRSWTFGYQSNIVRVTLPAPATAVEVRIDLDDCLVYNAALVRDELLRR